MSGTASSPPYLSVVAPAYNEEEGIERFLTTVDAQLRALPALAGKDWEIIVVDDGSSDGTAARARAMQERGLPVRVLQLSRNFGHQVALTAGMDAARGQVVVTMDADLQHPPEHIARMLAEMEAGADVVLMRKAAGQQRAAYKTGLAALFYRLMARISDTPTEPNVGDFRLLTGEVVEVLRKCRETHRFLRGLVSWAGFRQVVLEYEVGVRAAGEPKYTLRRLWHLASAGLFSHSSLPLKWPFFMGVPLFGLAALYMLWGLAMRLLQPEHTPPGWLSLLAFLSLFSGLTFIAQGIQGAYIAKIFEQVKERPLYVLRRSEPDRALGEGEG